MTHMQYFRVVGNSARGMDKSTPHLYYSLFATKLNVKKFYYLMCPPLSFDHRNIKINNIDKPSLNTCLFIGEQLGYRLHVIEMLFLAHWNCTSGSDTFLHLKFYLFFITNYQIPRFVKKCLQLANIHSKVVSLHCDSRSWKTSIKN